MVSLSKSVGVFYSNKYFTSVKDIMKIYNTLVLPHIQQNIIICDCLTQEKLNKRNVKWNYMQRFILSVKFKNNFQQNFNTNYMYKYFSLMVFVNYFCQTF